MFIGTHCKYLQSIYYMSSFIYFGIKTVPFIISTWITSKRTQNIATVLYNYIFVHSGTPRHCTIGSGADYRFLPGGGGKFSSSARSAQICCLPLPVKFLPPSVWGQSYNRRGQTFVTFIQHDLFICVVLELHFFEKTMSLNKHRN